MAMLGNLLLLFMMFSMGNARIKSRQCPCEWTNFENRCYKFFNESVNWITAERNCQRLGTNLASVHSKEENDFVLSLIPSSTRCWIGAHDGVQEKQWLWTDGSVYEYTNWCTKEPNNKNIENCAEINWTSDRCWNDEGCSTTMSYICATDL